MSTAELVEQLKRMSNAERMTVIEAATRLVRDEQATTEADREEQLAAAALAVKDLYEPGGDHTEWTTLDGEDFLDASLPR